LLSHRDGLHRTSQYLLRAASAGAMACSSMTGTTTMEVIMGRGILLWLIGVPIPVIILLALFFHH
jgi:hypothetical protein